MSVVSEQKVSVSKVSVNQLPHGKGEGNCGWEGKHHIEKCSVTKHHIEKCSVTADHRVELSHTPAWGEFVRSANFICYIVSTEEYETKPSKIALDPKLVATIIIRTSKHFSPVTSYLYPSML